MLFGSAEQDSGAILSREQSRLLDRLAMEQYGMSGLVLMENAGRGAVDVLCRLEGCFRPAEARDSCFPDSYLKEARMSPDLKEAPTRPETSVSNGPSVGQLTSASAASLRAESTWGQKAFDWHRLQVRHQDFGGPVVICCGRGNNAGDGLVMARHLWLRRHPVQVFLWSKPEELSPDAAANYAILQKAGFPIECFPTGHEPERLAQALAEASWIVDALLGTGARGQPRPPLDTVITQINSAGKPILAVDLPSGLDCDTGQASQPTIRATVTCTFAAAKPGLVRPEAQEYVGRLVVLDIGVPPPLLPQVLAYSPPEQSTP
ncbi:MAG: NAD(P)H-hydrate epimerase [Thermoguttaceae bacterium]|nr:NAD(P)H-hydrate epimerase [Thermoguttaceae bacterium]MDW8039762.1 NAD(P)H-hydrate epimerase [Thermoguttaceae bacterium]